MRSRQSGYLEVLINFLIMVGPLGIIIDGVVGLLERNPLHPDAFIQFGGLLMGTVSLVTVSVYGLIWWLSGRPKVPLYRKALVTFYGVWALLGIGLLLLTVGVIPTSWLFSWEY